MGKEEKTPQTVINIQTAYNVNPAATKVENNFFIGSGKEAAAAIREAVGGIMGGIGSIRGTGTFIHTINTIYSLKNRYLCVA